MARILLFGGGGLLGSALLRTLREGGHRLSICGRETFDIAAARWAALDVTGHDWVLNAAGIVRARAAPPAELWTVNAVFPHVLAACCARAGARLVHVSTDCVFDGAGPRDETSSAFATDPYGHAKRVGEPPGALTLRTSFVGPESHRPTGLLCWALRAAAIDGYLDHRWNGVTSLALAAAIRRVIEQNLFVAGVRHVHAEDTTKHALLTLIRDTFGHVGPIRAATGPAPRDTRLRTRHPDFLAALNLPPLAEQVASLVHRATATGAWRDA